MNMNVVYFPEQLNARAPALMGCLCAVPENRWLNLGDVAHALRNGEAVNIRQASPTELKRAEGLTALYEVGMIVGEKVKALLDQDPAATPEIKDAALYETLVSIGLPLPVLPISAQPSTAAAPIDTAAAADTAIVADAAPPAAATAPAGTAAGAVPGSGSTSPAAAANVAEQPA
jgi:hypothetical protein